MSRFLFQGDPDRQILILKVAGSQEVLDFLPLPRLDSAAELMRSMMTGIAAVLKTFNYILMNADVL